MSKADRWNAEVAFARIAELEDRIRELEAENVCARARAHIDELKAALAHG
jgi:predicted secreted Zn-dependent protease